MAFAKIFDTSIGQVLVMKAMNNEDEPQLQFHFESPSGAMVVVSPGFEDSNEGWDKRDEAFDSADLESVEKTTVPLFHSIGILST